MGYLLALSSTVPNVSEAQQSPSSHPTEASAPSSAQLCYQSKHGMSEPLFHLKDKTYHLSDLPQNDQIEYLRLQRSNFQRHESFLKDVALRFHLGGEDGNQTLEEILADKISVSDEEIIAFYKENHESFPQNMNLEKLRSTLKGHLMATKRREYASRVMQCELKDQGWFKVSAAAPCFPTTSLGSEGSIAAGPSDGAVVLTIVVDYFCAECRETWPRLDRWLRVQSNSVAIKVVPAAIGQGKGTAYLAKATYCAQQQGKARFLEFMRHAHRIPLQLEGDRTAIEEHIETEVLKEMQADRQTFAACLATHDAETLADAAKAATDGLTRQDLPLFLINQRLAIHTEGHHIVDLLDRVFPEENHTN